MTIPLGGGKLDLRPCTEEEEFRNLQILQSFMTTVNNFIDEGGEDAFTVKVTTDDAEDDFLYPKLYYNTTFDSELHQPVYAQVETDIDGIQQVRLFTALFEDGEAGTDNFTVKCTADDSAASFLHTAFADAGTYTANADLLVSFQTVGSGGTDQTERGFIDVSAVPGWHVTEKRILGIEGNVSTYFEPADFVADIYEAGCGIVSAALAGGTIQVDVDTLIGDGLIAGDGCSIDVAIDGCTIGLDGDGALAVNLANVAGDGLVANTTGANCKLDINVGCGLEIVTDALKVKLKSGGGILCHVTDGLYAAPSLYTAGCGIDATELEAGTIELDVDQLYGPGLEPGETCNLTLNLGCGLKFATPDGDFTAVMIDPSEMIAGSATSGGGLKPYNSEDPDDCRVTVFAGCGLGFGTPAGGYVPLVVDVDTLAGDGLGTLTTGDNCKLKVNVGCGLEIVTDAVKVKLKSGGGIACDALEGLYVEEPGEGGSARIRYILVEDDIAGATQSSTGLTPTPEVVKYTIKSGGSYVLAMSSDPEPVPLEMTVLWGEKTAFTRSTSEDKHWGQASENEYGDWVIDWIDCEPIDEE